MCREHHSCNHHGGMFQDRTNQPTNQPTKTKSTLSISQLIREQYQTIIIIKKKIVINSDFVFIYFFRRKRSLNFELILCVCVCAFG